MSEKFEGTVKVAILYNVYTHVYVTYECIVRERCYPRLFACDFVTFSVDFTSNEYTNIYAHIREIDGL